MNKKTFTTQLVVLAFLIALEIILTRFLSINTPIVRIGFGFLPVAMMGIIYGPLWAGAACALCDLLGLILFPSGAYFPGFTITAFLTGLVYGLILHGNPITWKRALLAASIVVLFLNLCLDTFWLSIIMGNGIMALLPARLLKAIIMLPVQTVMITVVWERIILKIPFIKTEIVK